MKYDKLYYGNLPVVVNRPVVVTGGLTVVIAAKVVSAGSRYKNIYMHSTS